MPNWRLVGYADDFVVLVKRSQSHIETLRKDITWALELMGLHLSETKTQTVHISEGFDFFGATFSGTKKQQ
ncbi:reverse transcriptase domain-containing protein [Mycobacterium leprae]|uniref:reverse transcriptase domain-containing protein n=1 Tax=Mycobacterium leprae TaxID=1769 RepID=UPI000E67A3A1|nr:reverse transcriptase domain-containing protein [Mycobacterium leprae]